ncbi:MAG: hypothetical protein AAGH19_02600 [Pseudomonadota bacterium]
MITKQPIAAPPGLLPFLTVLAALFLARSLVTFPIEHVDAAFKYEAAAKIVRGEGLAPLLNNQHTLRWSEVLPQVVVTGVTRFHYAGLYVLPLLAFALIGALIWRGLSPHLDRRQQLMLLALLFLEPVALTHTGQLLNPPFGVAYTLLALTVLARPGPTTWPRTVLVAALFFCAYGAHSTYLSFFAAGVAWLLVFERRWPQALGLIVFMAVLIGLETVFFNALSSDALSGGRLQALSSTNHMDQVMTRFKTHTALDLLTRWLELPLFSLAMAIGFAATVAYGLFRQRTLRNAPDFLVLCVLAGGAYAVAITFAVVSISPIRPIQPLRVMYLEPFMPFAVAVTSYAVARLERRLPRRLRPVLEGGALVGLVFLVGVAALQKGRWEEIANNRFNAFAWRADAELGAFADRFRDGDILLVGKNRYALEKIIQYSGPVTVRRGHRGAKVSGPTPLSAHYQCVTGIRRIPLVDNERDCTKRETRSARAEGLLQNSP